MTQWGLDTLFNPAKRHMDEEKRRLQSTREEIGDSSGGKRIDLESGKVTIRRENGVAEDETETPTAAPETEQTRGRAKDKPATGAGAVRAAKRRGDKPAPSAAAVRAAQRRGRQPR